MHDYSGMDLDNMLDALSDELVDDNDQENLLDEEFQLKKRQLSY